jgi:hypothetical protein
LRLQIQKRGGRRLEVQPEFVQVGDDTIIGSTQWLGADGRRQERFQVITLREGKIADMQGCSSRRRTLRPPPLTIPDVSSNDAWPEAA